MDVGTIATTLLALGAFTLFLVLLRRLPPAEDDVAAVVTTIIGTPVEPAACGSRGARPVAPRTPQARDGRPVKAI